jgi:predicted permease
VPEEDRAGGAPVAVVARGFAEHELGGADSALNRVITLGGVPRTVVGIADDIGPMNADVWIPIGRDQDYDRSTRNLRVLGALRDGVTVDAAERELSGLMKILQAEGITKNVDASAFVVPLRERYAGSARPALYAICAATLLVLLVTCANLAGIQLAQATSRGPEMAVRTAIGAGRARLFRQLVTENLLVAVVGGAAGLLLSAWVGGLAARAVLGDAPAWLTPAIDWRVQLFAACASALTGILFGIAPGIRLAKSDPAEVLRGGRATAASARARVQRTFVVAQMALSVALIIAAGLSVSSVARIERIALGFDPARVMTFSVGMQGRRYDDPAQRARFVADVEQGLAAIPGVSHAGASSTIPLRPCCLRWNLTLEGVASEPGRPLISAGGSASGGYFATMGIGLLAGRSFRSSDDGAAARVAVVNESFVRRFGKSALGRQLDFGFGPTTIVGIVKDVKQGVSWRLRIRTSIGPLPRRRRRS